MFQKPRGGASAGEGRGDAARIQDTGFWWAGPGGHTVPTFGRTGPQLGTAGTQQLLAASAAQGYRSTSGSSRNTHFFGASGHHFLNENSNTFPLYLVDVKSTGCESQKIQKITMFLPALHCACSIKTECPAFWRPGRTAHIVRCQCFPLWSLGPEIIPWLMCVAQYFQSGHCYRI